MFSEFKTRLKTLHHITPIKKNYTFIQDSRLKMTDKKSNPIEMCPRKWMKKNKLP